MPNENEGGAPNEEIKDSDAKQVLESLKSEGEAVIPPQAEPAKKEEKEEKKPDEGKKDTPSRTPLMVEAWKLNVAEDQKRSAEKKIADLEGKLNELSKQSSVVTQTQKEEIADDIDQIAEEAGVDASFLKKFADSVLKRAESRFKMSDDINKTVSELAKEREAERQERLYADEFEREIAPLVKGKYQLSDTALLSLKDKLKELAFSETYSKVPLKKIFRAEEDALEITPSKRSSEGRGVKIRSNDVIDIDNVTEEDFARFTPEQVEEFTKKKTASGWQLR